MSSTAPPTIISSTQLSSHPLSFSCSPSLSLSSLCIFIPRNVFAPLVVVIVGPRGYIYIIFLFTLIFCSISEAYSRGTRWYGRLRPTSSASTLRLISEMRESPKNRRASGFALCVARVCEFCHAHNNIILYYAAVVVTDS